MKTLLTILAIVLALNVVGQSDLTTTHDPAEIRLNYAENPYNISTQQQLKSQAFWQDFKAANSGWKAMFNEDCGLPHRAFGSPIAVAGFDACDRAENFISQNLSEFGIDLNQLSSCDIIETEKYTYANYTQVYNGKDVLKTRVTIKMTDEGVVMFGLDYYQDIVLDNESIISTVTALSNAEAGVIGTLQGSVPMGEHILPLYNNGQPLFKLVKELEVSAKLNNVPQRYMVFADAETGDLYYRMNLINHIHSEGEKEKGNITPIPAPLAVNGVIESNVIPLSPDDAQEVQGMGYLNINIDGSNVQADVDGNFSSTAVGPVNATFPLSGAWSTIFTDGNTPSFTTTLDEGANNVSFDNDANIKERSTYKSVNRIHDHVTFWIPDWTGMNFSMTTNIDVDGSCNAFYDGASINFFNQGGGCNATSLIADVVYHEYGHGINNEYYQDEGSFFNNGAMNEGYADFWALSLKDSPLLGEGFFEGDNDPLRRYDIDPKIYPQDLIGQVHNDGEIICGAWWDTHVLLDEDYNVTMPIFVEAFAGLQATAGNGNEGVAYVDVLLDALFADDDDGDIENGTPNALAILEGFDIHGITLAGAAEVDHNEVLSSFSEEAITITVGADISFPFNLYYSDIKAYWRVVGDLDWMVASLTEVGDDVYEGDIPAQASGTLIEYYIALVNSEDEVSVALPENVDLEVYPTLPYFILVGYAPLLAHDSDTFTNQFGAWTTGIPEDNASTGLWEEDVLIGSYSDATDPTSSVAPQLDHSAGDGNRAFITGQSNSPTGGMGENDVDAGSTTLMSPNIDLTSYENPAFTYWRWYCNAPDGGANPAADWWQVSISDDGGDTWTELENNLTQDVNWRRNALKVSDYFDLTTEFRMKWVAADSTTTGEELDGGSLVEAAMDDFILYDVSDVIPPALEATAEVTGANCADSDDGTVVVEATGGYPPYSIDYNGLDPNNMPAGTHTITVVDLNGTTFVLEITVEAPEPISLSFSGFPSVVCDLDEVIDMSEFVNLPGGEFGGPGFDGSNFDPAAAGPGFHTINYLYTDENGCQAQSFQTITVDDCSNIANAELLGISVSPNPFESTINITGWQNDWSLEVYDAQGKLVQNLNVNAESSLLTIDLTETSSGMHYVRILDAQGKTITVLNTVKR